MLTVAQAAEKLGVKPGLVRQILASGRLRHCRVGNGRGVIRIPEDALEEYVRSVTVDANPGSAAPEQAWRKKVTSRYFRLSRASPAGGHRDADLVFSVALSSEASATMTAPYAGFEERVLDDGHRFFVGRLPDDLLVTPEGFESLWALHPEDYHAILMHGRRVETPRWQQAYGSDYHYIGRTNAALPAPAALEPFRGWARRAVDDRLNGLLLNWYDGRLGHYIGPHHDSTRNMAERAPIVTISLGEARTFRLSHPKLKLTSDFVAGDGAVFVMPADTNLAWKQSVPKSARSRGRRISITLRAFRP